MKTNSKNQNAIFDNLNARRSQNFMKGAKPIIGIDVGTSSVKVVQMKKNNKIDKWGVEPLPEGLINQGRIESPEHLAKMITELRSKYKIAGKECSLCISSSELIIRELRMPEMAEGQIVENVKNEITSYLPINHDEYTIDYKILECIKANGKAGSLRILATAAPNRLLQSYIDTMKMAKMKVSYIDVAPNIAGKIARWITMNNQNANRSDICIIDFGATTTNIVVIKDGNYFIHKNIINGGEYLTSIISDKMNMPLDEAETIKKNKNFFDDNANPTIVQQVQNFVDYFVVDIERILEFFKSRNEQKNIDCVYIMGGGSMLLGLPKYLEERIGVKVMRVTDALLQHKNDKESEALSFLFNAVGSTMREE